MKSNLVCPKGSWTVVTYAQDFSQEGAALGPQSILRLQAIVSARTQGTFNVSDIVLSCGMCPNPREYPHQERSLACLMKEWLVREGGTDPDIVHASANDEAWNCIEATLDMISIIKKLGLPRNVLVVSTGFHIYPRMWTTWKLLLGATPRWRLAFLPVWDGTYDALHEIGGTVKYIPMALWYRFSRTF